MGSSQTRAEHRGTVAIGDAAVYSEVHGALLSTVHASVQRAVVTFQICVRFFQAKFSGVSVFVSTCCPMLRIASPDVELLSSSS